MTAIRIGLKKGNQVKIAHTEEDRKHFESLGFEVLPDDQQPTQPDDERPVVVQRMGRIKRTTVAELDRWLDLGYEPVGGVAQEQAEAAFDKAQAKHNKARAEKKPKKLPKAKPQKKKPAKQKKPDRNARLAELLGALPERDDATKAIVALLQKGYDVDTFAEVLVDWNVKTLTEVPQHDRAEFLLDLQNKANG